MAKPRLVYSKLKHTAVADRPVALGTFDHPPTPIPDEPGIDIERERFLELTQAIATGRRQIIRQLSIIAGIFAVACAILGAALIVYHGAP